MKKTFDVKSCSLMDVVKIKFRFQLQNAFVRILELLNVKGRYNNPTNQSESFWGN